MTLEDHQSSPIVVAPFHMLDVCLQSDGGTAFLVTTAERAKDLQKPPVPILGVGFGEQMADLWWEKKHYTTLAVKQARDAAFGMAGIELKGVSFQQLYDCFTSEVLIQLEDYGWCGKGEGGPFVREGHLGPKGDVPVNTGGGLLSSHHFGSMTGFAEAVRQLRHEAGARQVPNATVGTVSGHGGEVVSGGMCSIHSTLVLGSDR
jgi:acetyl-CoA acetyltransferase